MQNIIKYKFTGLHDDETLEKTKQNILFKPFEQKIIN